MAFDDEKYIKSLSGLTEGVNKMQNSRYWSLWTIGLLFALAAFISAIKWW